VTGFVAQDDGIAPLIDRLVGWNGRNPALAAGS
jgi:hypothetical protein